MKNKDTARLRAAWIPYARGEVLEVGMGSGLNLPFYGSKVRKVHALDPSPELQSMARKRVAGPIEVEFLLQAAETPMQLLDASMDTVVTTWTLCSIADVSQALQQMRRVLKPSGQMIFVEHGRAPDASVIAWQDRLTPMWKRVTGGCHLNRKVDDLIISAGFQITKLEMCYMPGPRPTTYTYQGLAQP